MGFNSGFKGLMKLEFSRQIFEKYTNSKFHENYATMNPVFPCGQTDRHEEEDKSFFEILRTRLKKLTEFC